MQHPHFTGSADTQSNVYRIGVSTVPLKSQKPFNPFRAWIEKFCKLPPTSRLKIMKALLDEHEADAQALEPPLSEHPPRPSSAFLLENGVSRDLWERYERAQAEAWGSVWLETTP